MSQYNREISPGSIPESIVEDIFVSTGRQQSPVDDVQESTQDVVGRGILELTDMKSKPQYDKWIERYRESRGDKPHTHPSVFKFLKEYEDVYSW